MTPFEQAAKRDAVAAWIARFEPAGQLAIGGALLLAGIVLVRLLARRADRFVAPPPDPRAPSATLHPALLPLTLLVWLVTLKLGGALFGSTWSGNAGSRTPDLTHLASVDSLAAVTLLVFLGGWAKGRGETITVLGIGSRSLAALGPPSRPGS